MRTADERKKLSNGDNIFSRKATSIACYSAEIMKISASWFGMEGRGTMDHLFHFEIMLTLSRATKACRLC